MAAAPIARLSHVSESSGFVTVLRDVPLEVPCTIDRSDARNSTLLQSLCKTVGMVGIPGAISVALGLALALILVAIDRGGSWPHRGGRRWYRHDTGFTASS
jgi:hypothetical protein